MRILTIANVPRDPDSGAAGTVFHTNVALRALGHEVTEVWRPDLGRARISHGNLHALIEQPRLYRNAVRRTASVNDYDLVLISQPQAYLAARWLKRNGFNGLVLNRSHGLELAVDAVLPAWHRKLGVPASRFPRSLFTPLLQRMLAAQWPKTLKACDGVVLPSRHDRDFLAAAFPGSAERCRCIHHGLAPDFVGAAPPPLTPDRLRRLLYVGQHAFIKGYPVLVDVLTRALAADPDLTCTWVTGKEAHEEIRRMIPAALHARLTLQGWLPHGQLPELYDRHGVFLFPSFFEGAGKAALEAMSRRLLLVSSDTGAMRDYVADSQGGVLCPVGDAGAFHRAIQQAVARPEEAAITADRGYAYARLKTWQANAQGIVDFCHALKALRDAGDGR